MEKKDSSKAEEIKTQNYGTKKLNSSNLKRRKEKRLPWWVELLFVQIGLPDRLLIKILKSKKKFKELIKSDKNLIYTFVLFFGLLGYFYPVVRYSKSKLDCTSFAKKYIIQKKNLKDIKQSELSMLSTNFCNGGNEIYEIQKMNK